MSMDHAPRTSLRVLTYNVRGLRDDGDAAIRVIADSDADVVCIQEAPRFLRWRSKAAAIARRSGLVVVTGGRSAAANLLLCDLRVDVLAQEDVLFTHRRRTHQRGAAVGVFALTGSRFCVVGTHLDLFPADRERHAREVLEIVDRQSVPTIVAGDINESAGEPAWEMLGARLADTSKLQPAAEKATFSTSNPRRRIDNLFADRALPVRAVRVIDTPDVRVGSDHRPVAVDIDLS